MAVPGRLSTLNVEYGNMKITLNHLEDILLAVGYYHFRTTFFTDGTTVISFKSKDSNHVVSVKFVNHD